MKIFISEAVSQAIAALSFQGAKQSKYPRNQWWNKGDERYSKSDDNLTWFKRLISGDLDRLEQCSVSENLAVFGQIDYIDECMYRCSIQALVTNDVSLLDFVVMDEIKDNTPISYYYRLDLDPVVLGPLFKEPCPHLHINPHGEPRIAFKYGENKCLLSGFFEFIYLNHFYGEWEDWARKVSKTFVKVDLFDMAADAFKKGYLLDRKKELERYLLLLRCSCNKVKKSISKPVLLHPSYKMANFRLGR